MFYKVVSAQGAELQSWSLMVYAPISYGPGIESRPNEGWGPLAVFGDLWSAVQFMREHGSVDRDPTEDIGALVLKCEIEPSNLSTVFSPGYQFPHALPFGTHLADCVRGIEIVKPEELPEHMDELRKQVYRADYDQWVAMKGDQ
jgi:hypothetical protein